MIHLPGPTVRSQFSGCPRRSSGKLTIKFDTKTFGAMVDPTASAHSTMTGSVTKSADGLSLTLDAVTITVTNADTGVAVEVVIPTGERTTLGDVATPEATAVFSATGATVTTTTTTTPTEGDEAVVTDIQTFTGLVMSTFLDEGVGLDLGLKTLFFDGSVVTAAAPGTFTADIWSSSGRNSSI